jgi:hypothetical protein
MSIDHINKKQCGPILVGRGQRLRFDVFHLPSRSLNGTNSRRYGYRKVFILVGRHLVHGILQTIHHCGVHRRHSAVDRTPSVHSTVVRAPRAAFTALEHQTESRSSKSALADLGANRREERGEWGNCPYKQEVELP